MRTLFFGIIMFFISNSLYSNSFENEIIKTNSTQETVDISLYSLDSPNLPVSSGNKDVIVSIKNVGSTLLTSASIVYSLNDVIQGVFSWNGTLGSGAIISNINIGSLMLKAGIKYNLKIWVDLPDEIIDNNLLNDTIQTTFTPTLCGSYTIGGQNPDFRTISEAISTLNSAGVSCPVVFKIRDGVYNEQLQINTVPGSSYENTITFESESLDSSKVTINTNWDISSYPYTILVDGAKHIRFNNIGISKSGTYWDYYALKISGSASDIEVNNCFINPIAATGIYITDSSDSILVRNSTLTGSGSSIYNGSISGIVFNTTGEVIINNNIITQFQTSGISGSSKKARIIGNLFDQISVYVRSFGYAINVNVTDSCIISGNTLTRVVDGISVSGDGSYVISENKINFGSGKGLNASIRNSKIYNNWIYNLYNQEITTTSGVSLNGSSNTMFVFNTINIIKSNKNTNAIQIDGGSGLSVQNNIFSINQLGAPLYIKARPNDFTCDYNVYYSPYRTVGFFGNSLYNNLSDWQSAIGGEANGIISNPFFDSDSLLNVNQILFNNKGLPIEGISFDIDSILRDSQHPDIGAKEYQPCSVDAGINSVLSPLNSINSGTEEVKVQLQNQGTSNLTSVEIHYSINGETAVVMPWSGSIESGQNAEVSLGLFNFSPTVEYKIKVWTSSPNGEIDCNSKNDTISSLNIYTKLCGTYTIGGDNADFKTISKAVEFLKTAGVSCPVVFKIRDGVYNEQITIDTVPGSSYENTITFESESLDSSKVTINTNWDISSYPYTILVDGAKHIRFNNIGISKSGTYWDYYALKISGSASDIEVNNCFINPIAATGIYITDSSDSILVRNSTLTGSGSSIYNGSISGIVFNTTGEVIINNNIITQFQTSGISGSSKKARIIGNLFDQISVYVRSFGYAINVNVTDSCIISGNTLTRVVDGISVSGDGSYVISENKINFGSGKGLNASIRNSKIYNNWIYNLYNQEITTTSGVSLNGSSNTMFVFNTINIIKSNKNTNAIQIDGGSGLSVQNNIFSINQLGAPLYIKARPNDFTCDYNVYYSPYRTVGFFGNSLYNNLSDWQSAIGGEANGIISNPFFDSDSLLNVNQILFNNKGLPIEGISFDIDSILRDSQHPDIGAKEYQPCSVDAGINSVLSPLNSINSGTEEVKVQLQNQGTSNLTSVEIHYSINGETAVVMPWSGSIESGQNAEVSLGLFNFSPTVEYKIKVWTSSPNGEIDCNSKNDTISSLNIYTKLCGTYTIGGDNADFKTISKAVEFLKTAGVSCPVVFKIRDGVYNEQITIDTVPGSSYENTITFESESLDSSKVTINTNWDISSYPYTILVDGAKHIRFNNIGISKSGTYWDYYALKISGSASDIEVNNCFINTVLAKGIYIIDSADSIQISNSHFIGSPDPPIGFTTMGILLSTTGGVRINNNDIHLFKTSAIQGNAKAVYIENNFIHDITGGSTVSGGQAINIDVTDTALIASNILTNSRDGILASGTGKFQINSNRVQFQRGSGMVLKLSNSIVSNNWVYNSDSTATTGIEMNSCTNMKLLFNSIHIRGKNNNATGVIISNGAQNSAFNNIFSNMSGGVCVKIVNGLNGLSSNYNNFYSPYGLIGNLNSTIFNSLSSWAATINTDANSIFSNPFFTNDTLPNPNQVLLKNAANPTSEIIFDIDSTSRLEEVPISEIISSSINISPKANFNFSGIANESKSIVTNQGKKSELKQSGLGKDTIRQLKIQTMESGAISTNALVLPDIGAKQFSICRNDAGINQILGLTLPIVTGINTIKIQLQNQGVNDLNSVIIGWSINGVVQNNYVWNGSLKYRQNIEVNLESIKMYSGVEYRIKVWTTTPNGIADCNANNDSTNFIIPGDIIFNLPPPITFNDTICQGNSAILIAKGIGKITWYDSPVGGNYLGTGDTLNLLSQLESKVFYAQDSTLFPSITRSAVSIIVNRFPTVPLVSPVSYCLNSLPVQLSAVQSGNDTLVWYGEQFGGIGSRIAPTPNTNIVGTTSYYVSQVNASGCESERVKLDVTTTALPIISGNLSACVGSATTLTGSGTPAVVGSWLSSNTAVATVDNAGVVRGISAGISTITYTAASGCSQTAVVTIAASPVPSFTVNSASQVLSGNSFVFTNTSTGGNTYLWRFGNGATATTQNATYSYAAAGSYVVRLIVTSAAGCQDSTSTTVTVTAPPPPPPAVGNLYVAGTTCAQFNGRTASALTRLCYTVRTTPATRRNPAVTSVSAVTPSSFMYYVRVTAPSSSFTVNIGQVVDRAGFRLFTVNTGGSVASGDNCVRVASVTTPSTGQARVSISRATTGRTYIIGVRYDTSPLVGYVTNGTLTANYTFSAKIGTQTLANSTSSVTLYPNNCASAPASIISSRTPDSKEIDNTNNTTNTSAKALSITNLNLKVYPNPTSHYFNVVVEGGSPQTDGVVRVMNMVGQLIEERKQVKPGQLIQLGHQYINGMYLIEYTQGTDRATIKVNKH